MMKTPTFWETKGLVSTLLLPLSGVWYLLGTLRTLMAKKSRARLPVICVGNLSAGGTGKTPLVTYLYDWCIEEGFRPAILSRGYGGRATETLWVDPKLHDAALCGDEPLMLADSRDVVVSRDRVNGARAIAERGLHDVILMDDGLQNPFLEQDLKIGVFDGSVGIGNGRLIPAGPLRVSFGAGVAELHIALINGEDETSLSELLPSTLVAINGTLLPDQTLLDALGDTPLLAFAGIGRPERFFRTIRRAGCNLVHALAFADHHPYSEHDLIKLQEDASRFGAQLITTRKDWIRLPVDWRERITFVPVTIELDNDAVLKAMMRDVIAKRQKV